MIKFCLKENCQEVSIPRGKYCVKHSKSRRKIIIEEEKKEECITLPHINDNSEKPWYCAICTYQNNSKSLECEMCLSPRPSITIKKKEKETRIINSQNEINKDLIKEQDENFRICMLEDKEKFDKLQHEKDLKISNELNEKIFIENKRKSILKEPDDFNCYNIQIKLPSGKSIKRKFPNSCKFIDIKNFLDIYFIDNNLKIFKYDLIIFPKITFTESNNDEYLNKHNLQKNLTFFISILD